MSPKELAAKYEAKVFETPEAAESAGFQLTTSMSPRNTWNKASAAQAILHELLTLKKGGQAAEIGLVLEPWSVTGCYKSKAEG
jgi:hypothetical protein